MHNKKKSGMINEVSDSNYLQWNDRFITNIRTLFAMLRRLGTPLMGVFAFGYAGLVSLSAAPDSKMKHLAFHVDNETEEAREASAVSQHCLRRPPIVSLDALIWVELGQNAKRQC